MFQWLFVDTERPPRPPSPSRAVYPAEDCGIDPTDDALECALRAGNCS